MQNEEAVAAWVEKQMMRLPATYFYHNYAHNLYVRQKAEEIGKAEDISETDMRLLVTAALWHDVGHVRTYEGHEEAGCELAREHLPGFGFSAEEIKLICGMVMATKMPQSPVTKLEQVIADADLSYLGTSDAAQQADNLFRELQWLTPGLTKEDWEQKQLHFLKDHRYFTSYAESAIEPGKQAYLQSLKADDGYA